MWRKESEIWDGRRTFHYKNVILKYHVFYNLDISNLIIKYIGEKKLRKKIAILWKRQFYLCMLALDQLKCFVDSKYIRNVYMNNIRVK